MALLVISPVNLENYPDAIKDIIKGNFVIGWLHEYKDGITYTTWGMSKIRQDALNAVNDWLAKNKYKSKDIITYDKPISKTITLDELKRIKEMVSSQL